MDKENSVLTNITLQTFASEGDAALIDQRWEEKGPAFLKSNNYLTERFLKKLINLIFIIIFQETQI